MRYLFAAVIAVFVVAVDLEGSGTKSVWTEPSFVVAEAQSEPVTPAHEHSLQDAETRGGTAAAWSETSTTPDTAHVATTPSEKAATADAPARAAASVGAEPASADPICDVVRSAAE